MARVHQQLMHPSQIDPPIRQIPPKPPLLRLRLLRSTRHIHPKPAGMDFFAYSSFHSSILLSVKQLMALSEAYMAWETELKGASCQEGRQEEKVAIALNMLQRNIPPDVVAEVTGLTIAEIQQLQTTAQ
jgi:hypothetical protein